MVQSLRRTTATTFEELALLFPEADLSPEQAAAPLDAMVSVDFRGPLTGRLVLRASDVILPSISANMLGESDARKPTLQRDALGELANVICGNLLPQIGGLDAIFHLSAPRVHEAGAPLSRANDEPMAHVQFGIDEGRADATLFLFGPNRAPTPATSQIAVG